MKQDYLKTILLPVLSLFTVAVSGQQLPDMKPAAPNENILQLLISPLTITSPADTLICSGQGIWLYAAATGGHAQYTYAWNNATDVGDRLYVQPDATTTYLLTVQDGSNASASRLVTVRVEPRPQAKFDIRPDSLYVSEAEVQFINQSSGAAGAYLNWGEKGATAVEVLPDQSLLHNYRNEGIFRVSLIASSAMGCRDTAYKEVNVLKDFYVWIPTAFTPDNSGSNETFYPYGEGIREYSMIVFNRWGQEVFRSRAPGDAWTGCLYNNPSKTLEEGTYAYYIEVKNQHHRSFVYKGTVNLIR